MNLRVMVKLKSLPGPRYRSQGEGSGEAFREDHLIPAFEKAVAKGERLTVDMGGAKYGYPTSFLEETFGGLARSRGTERVKATLEIRSVSEPLLKDEIMHYVAFAERDRTPPFEPEGGAA